MTPNGSTPSPPSELPVARRGQRTLLRRFFLLRKIASILLPEYRFKSTPA